MSCGVGHGLGSGPALLWLWCRPAAVAPIHPLIWEPPYAPEKKMQKKKKDKKPCTFFLFLLQQYELHATRSVFLTCTEGSPGPRKVFNHL